MPRLTQQVLASCEENKIKFEDSLILYEYKVKIIMGS